MTISRFFLYASFLCLIACGGGSGGDPAALPGYVDNTESFDPPVDNATPVEYEGVTAAAVLDTTNVGDFVYNALADSEGYSFAQEMTASGGGATGFNAAAVSGNSGLSRGITVSGFLRRLAVDARIQFNTSGKKSPPQSQSDNAGFTIAAVSDSYDYAEQYSENCETGRIDYYLMLYDEGNGTMVADHHDCREDGVVTDGLITFDIYE